MKSGSIRRSEEAAIPTGGRSKRATGGLPPTVPLPGGSCGYGGRVSEPCDGYYSQKQHLQQQPKLENHHHHQNQHHPRHQYQMDNGIQQQQDDVDDNDESFASSSNSADKENNNNNNRISPDNSSYEQHHDHCTGRSSSVASDSYGSSYATSSQTIALFGASGITGGHFLQMALDAGYGVRCLPVDDPREVLGGGGKGPCASGAASWKTIKAGLEDPKQLKRVLKSVDYVVVMLNDLLPGKKDYPESFLSDFAARLYPLMRRQASIQVFLYQATSLASDVRGQTPMLSKVLKAVAQRRNFFLRDQDAVVRKIASEHMLRSRPRKDEDGCSTTTMTTPHFAFVVTRPTVLLQDGPSSKKLSASKSQPGPFPVAHVDLAEFSLNALTTERLYNTSPYIVADSF